MRHLRFWRREAECYRAANSEGYSWRTISSLIHWCDVWPHQFLSHGLVHFVHVNSEHISHLFSFLYHSTFYNDNHVIMLHFLLFINLTTGDNLVDRSVDLCKEAFQLIPYDPMQGTHPALGVVDHVSTWTKYAHHHYDIFIQNITSYSKCNSSSFQIICRLYFSMSSTDRIQYSL